MSTPQDEPRLLHKRSQLGYTQRASEAMSHEPEAVSPAEQDQITRDARRAANMRDADLVRASQARISAELAFLAAQKLDRRLASTIKAMQRQCAQLKHYPRF